MKNSDILFGQQVLDANKEIYKHLRRINDLIKNPLSGELGFEKLQEVNTEDFNPGLIMYYFYIKGKYYSLLYKYSDKSDVAYLELANDCFDDIVGVAKENGLIVKNIKYLFVRAHTKFLLSQGSKKEDVKTYFLAKAVHITDTTLRFHPSNSSFLWLQKQLTT